MAAAEAKQRLLTEAANDEAERIQRQRDEDGERAAEAIARSQLELAWKKKGTLKQKLGKVKKDDFMAKGIDAAKRAHRESVLQTRAMSPRR